MTHRRLPRNEVIMRLGGNHTWQLHLSISHYSFTVELDKEVPLDTAAIWAVAQQCCSEGHMQNSGEEAKPTSGPNVSSDQARPGQAHLPSAPAGWGALSKCIHWGLACRKKGWIVQELTCANPAYLSALCGRDTCG